MKEKAIAKINKVGKIGHVLAKIIRVCLIIGFVGTIIGELVLFVLPSDLFKVEVSSNLVVTISNSSLIKLTKGNLTDADISSGLDAFSSNGTLNISDDEFEIKHIDVVNGNTVLSGDTKNESTVTVIPVRIALALTLVIIACSYVLFYFVGQLSDSLMTCETPFAENVITALTRFAYGLMVYVIVASSLGSVSSGLVSGSYSSGIHINLSGLLIALAVYALTIVFKYGAYLQQESDETL